MRDKPDAADLLEIARATLVENLLPQLPAEHKYSALMVAVAMGIAQREARNGDTALDDEHEILRELLGAEDGTSLEDLNRRFAAELRSGAFDPPGSRHDTALRLLREGTLARLAECNPGYLEKDG